LIGVNPDPAHWDEVLLPFQVKELQTIIPEAIKGSRPVHEVTMAKAKLNDGQTIYAVNDLFIGHRAHVSARYQIAPGSKKDNFIIPFYEKHTKKIL
jgi:hypothetical protein